MKKIIVIFLIFLSSFSFIIAYNKTDKEEINNIENVEKGIAKQFVIPNDSIISSPEALYPILFETANECKVNIFRTNISYMSNDKVKITKYILLIKNTSFYDVFRLKNGRLLNEKDTQKTNLFMSTSNTHDKNQIGTIKDFGNNNMVMVKPLNTSYESLPVNGQYFAEVSDEKAFNAFIKIFVGKVNKNIKTSFTPEDFTENSNAMGAQSSSSVVVLQYIYYVSIFIVLILLIYYIFNESKKIGIIKMHGVSNIRVWFIIVGRLVTIIFVLSIVGSLILTVFVKDTTFKFVYSTILYQLKNYVIMISISLVSYLYILNIKVSHIIKNKKDTNGIFFLNMILKVACSITLILLCASVLNQYGNIHKKQESLKNWNYSKDYGVFYPLDIGNNQQDMKNNLKIFFSSTNGQLYNIFEKMGSLLINARVYEETSLLLNKDYTGIKSLVVNTNYLRQFPVYDINNKIVTVSDYTTDWVLLVPMKYHNKENEIKEFFEQDRRDSVDYEKNFFNIKASDDIKNQHIKIIWVANNQKIFSFNPEVFKTENNTILEPIIQVITTKNSLMADRSSILGGGCTDPLKVKLINRDPALTYKTLEPELIKLKLDDNMKHLIRVDQFVLNEIYDLQKQVKELFFIGIGLIIGLLIIIVQNLIIFFNKNQRKFIVRRLFGIGFFRTYKEYGLLFLGTWSFQILICCIFKKAVNLKLLEVISVIMLIELVSSVTALIIIEKRNMVKVLKGGTN